MTRFYFILVVLISLSFHLNAETIEFKGSGKFDLAQMKKSFKVHKVDIYNYSTRSFEKYHAFSMKEILDSKYSRNKWSKYPFIKITSNDKYMPMAEVYKFLEREPFLAFERYDGKPFTTMSGYKDVISKLGPYYLIWKEKYEKNKVAQRRDHWAFGIIGFELADNPPSKFIPSKEVHEDITWGYKNFLKQCIACHQIDGYGSPKDGELISNGLIDSKTDIWLKALISDPKSVKKETRKDPFPLKIDGRTTRIKNIIKYLRFISKKKKKNYRKSKTKSLDKLLDEAN